MRKPLKIGDKEYKSKKSAIAYYRAILHSYNFNESLSDSDCDDLIALSNHYYTEMRPLDNEATEENESDIEGTDENEIFIDDIKVSKVQFNTKCFEFFYSDGSSCYISYLMFINKNAPYNPERLFYIACRNAIHSDIRAIKQSYFDQYSIQGQVKCQETGMLSKWTDLVVDHRQPNTFSIIVDRFKEVNNFDLDAIEFIVDEQNHLVFKEQELTLKFRAYHKVKASLRVVRKECNASRTAMGRIKKTKKDLIIP